MNQLKKIFYYFCTTCRPNKSRTVRFAFPLIATAIVLLGALGAATSNQSYITVESSKTSVRAGDTFHINVFVSAHVPINAIDIQIKFPPSQIKIKGIDTGESVITLWTKEPYASGDTVFLSGGTFRKGFLGKHLIATINAQATDAGLAYVNVADALLLAGDGSGTTVKTAKNSAEAAELHIANSDGSPVKDGVSKIEGTAEIRIITDIDGDGKVTLNDISRFMSAWHSGSIIYDFSGDGRMSFTDFAIILADSFFK